MPSFRERYSGGKRRRSGSRSRRHRGGANLPGSVGNATPVTSSMGGGGAAEFGMSVYGAGDSQSAAPGGNVIAMNHVQAGGNALQSLIKGGVGPLAQIKGGVSPLAQIKGGVGPLTALDPLAQVTVGGAPLTPVTLGGGDLAFTELTGGGHPLVKGGAMVDIAVPAALLFANTAYGRRTTGPVHMIGNVGRSVGKRLNRSVGSVRQGLSRSVRFSPFKGRKSQRRRRTRGGNRLKGG